jgi:hypothetical protein
MANRMTTGDRRPAREKAMGEPSSLSRRHFTVGALVAIGTAVNPSMASAAGTTNDQLTDVLKVIDARQRSIGDYRAEIYIESNEKGKVTLAYEAQVFRRAAAQEFVILFTAPKASQGQGYLRVQRNIWFYDPSVGKWERRTERERIGGTNARRSDFDQSRLSEEYDPEDAGREKLGVHDAQVITLRGRHGVDLAYPVVKLWVDQATNNVLKRQDFALSGRLLRTAYFPKWKQKFSQAKKGDVWYAEEARIYDEIEKENSTFIVVKSVDFTPLESNLFTKAWLESKSR